MAPRFMKLNRSMPVVALVLSGWCLSITPARAQHAHLYAGAVSPNSGQPLWFSNGAVWDTNSWGGYAQSPACIYLETNIPALYPGLFQTATTFAAEPATIFNGGPSPSAAALGTYVEMRFASLQGPSGGALTVWNEFDDPAHPAALFSIPVGTGSGTNRLNLSEGDPADPESDPYGHIHGRRFTLNKPGLYIVGLQLVDTAHHGPGGGPKQSPSAVTYFYLQAGLGLGNFSRSNNVTVARFGRPASASYVWEASPVVKGTNWATVASITGATHSELRWVRETNAAASARFYRLRKTN